MAKYEITYSCGHTETIELYGNQDERFRRLAWLEKNGKCSKCYRREKYADAMGELIEAGYETLNDGSDKQRAWAESLRLELLQDKSANYTTLIDMDAICSALMSANCPKGKFADFDAAKKSVIDYTLRNRLSAKWWIDARGNAQAQNDVITEWAATITKN